MFNISNGAGSPSRRGSGSRSTKSNVARCGEGGSKISRQEIFQEYHVMPRNFAKCTLATVKF
jgi:hypothetical protein